MRLLETRTLKLKMFVVLFKDIQKESSEEWKDKTGAIKILKSAKICTESKIAYIWIDTCCIDKSSSAELSEAINSMFEWYRQSHVCYAYLSDVLSNREQDPPTGIVPFEKSRWFTRGWTAPSNLQFFDRAWLRLGGRATLADILYSITRIKKSILRSQDTRGLVDTLSNCSVHTKMVWASRRITTRAEDRAYSLMGLFNVNMPLLYGEGGRNAFDRLQDEIIKRTNDQSILLHEVIPEE
ncbi:HET-domain-containing protein [Xylaria venustula]|nr:HET-domain-containing protein [Xylaria venustula]